MNNQGVNFQFDARQVPPATAGQPQWPISDANGWPVVIVNSEWKENSKKDGAFLEFTAEITDGPNKGFEGPYRLNLNNQSADAVRIAYSQMSALCHVTGMMQITNSIQLHGKPFRMVVGPQTSEEGKAKGYTQVTGVKDINGNDAGKAPQGQPQQMQQPVQQQQPAQQMQPGPQQQQPNQGGNGWGPPNQTQPGPQQGPQPQAQAGPGNFQPQPMQQQPGGNGGPPWGGR